jgi:hypothetical protein
MKYLFVLTFFIVVSTVDLLLKHGESRSLTWPISPSQNLLIDCQSYGATSHFFFIKVHAEASNTNKLMPIVERRIENGDNKLLLTVPHPVDSTNCMTLVNSYDHYVVTVSCQSQNQFDELVWNLVSLQLHSNFDHILEHNQDPKLTEEQKKYNHITEKAQ